jgi:AcrR family transcriptional regulator
VTAVAASHEGHLDPRCVRSREKILAAAVDLLREEGFDGVSIEALAARSKVAKTTICRNFDDRESICFEALESLVQCPDVGDSGDVVVDITAALDELARSLRAQPVGNVLSSFFGAADRCERAAELTRELAARRRRTMLRRLRAAQLGGQLDGDVDVGTLASVLVGPIFFRRYVSRQPIGPAFVASLVATTLAPLVERSAAAGSGPVGVDPVLA